MKRKKFKKMLNLVQVSKKALCENLRHITARLNQIDDLKGKDLAVWKEIEFICEAMTDQPGRDTVYNKKEDDSAGITVFTGFSSKYRDRNKKPVPLPGFAVNTFNRLAEKNPVRLKVWKSGDRIEPGHEPMSEGEWALCLLWAAYFHGEGWRRVKRCPQCKAWYVDDTANLKKERCSKTCTDKWWSRSRRKESSHKLSKIRKTEETGVHTPKRANKKKGKGV